MFIIIIIIIAYFAITACFAYRKTAKYKGELGEKTVANLLQRLSDDYVVMNDVVLPTKNGTTQIDHIIVSKYGVFTIETKNYRGEIYGDDSRDEWTQIIVTKVRYKNKWWKVYKYVTKNKLYNPVKQSIGHAFRIKEVLNGYADVPIVPIVAFLRDADLSNVHSNHSVVYCDEIISIIDRYKVTYDFNVYGTLQILRNMNVRKVVDNKRHISNLKNAELERQDKISSGICPKCGGNLILRQGKYGRFYGCSNYPKCKFTYNQ